MEGSQSGCRFFYSQSISENNLMRFLFKNRCCSVAKILYQRPPDDVEQILSGVAKITDVK